MRMRLTDLRCREVVSVTDAARLGFVGDVELEGESGQVLGLIVPGRLRLFGLLGREKERYIPWQAVRQLGEEIILVDEMQRE